jgi:hypothetical protein
MGINSNARRIAIFRSLAARSGAMPSRAITIGTRIDTWPRRVIGARDPDTWSWQAGCMTNNTWAVTLHREGDASTTVGYEGPDAESALKFVAEDLGLDVDEEGNVTGDPQIIRLTVESAPDMHDQ